MPDNPYQKSEPDNPYQSPAANIGGYQSINTGDGVSAQTVDLLARTRPWTLFLAILGFIGCGFMVLGAFGMMASGISALVSQGLVYIAMAAIYVLPAVKLLQYSSAISNLRINPSTQNLETAMDKQRSFWKTMGIFSLICIVLVILLVVIGISVASSMSSRYR